MLVVFFYIITPKILLKTQVIKMCTAISFKKNNHYFGRNLDLEFSYGEKIVIVPREFLFEFRHTKKIDHHFSMIGMGIIKGDFPLYFDATNEKGLSMAGLNFPYFAKYNCQITGKTNITSFELIPYILCQCKTTSEAKKLLLKINLVNTPFDDGLPPTPLHWIISDKNSSITLESTVKGIKLYDNPVGVLTNSPDFEKQMFNLNNYANLSFRQVKNNFSKKVRFLKYSNGMGAIGLPGDFSSCSRFVRACFTKLNSICDDSNESAISQFFHILNSVSQIRGTVKLENGKYEKTVYSSCCNTDKCIYYYTTYENFQLSAVNLYNENLDTKEIISYPLANVQQINQIN